MKCLYFGALSHLVFKRRFGHVAGAAFGTRPLLIRDDAMPLLTQDHDFDALSDRLRDADAVTAKLMPELIAATCRRYPSIGQPAKTARIERLLGSQAWTDVALALIDLELPQWQVRRIAYDEGEWHCALSRARELPEWLDQSIEARHADLPLAILSAYLDAQCISTSSRRTSVPLVPRHADAFYTPFCCDNFA
jgi:hypothetical protein